MEQVIKSHLRNKVESIDEFVKTHARQCMKDISIKTPYDFFDILKMKPITFDVGDLVNNKHESVTICTVIQNWISFVGSELKQPIVSLSNQMLSVKIWKMFITRMSLNPWFIICSDPKKSAECGLEVLDLFMEVCKDIVYSSFKIDISPPKMLDNVSQSFVSKTQLQEPIQKPQTSKQFKTLFETTPTKLKSNPTHSDENEIRLPSIEEENPISSDSELKKIKNGVAFSPNVEKKGTLVKIQHRKVTNDESKKKPRKPRVSKKRISSDSSESD
jgi:hypothetical protein